MLANQPKNDTLYIKGFNIVVENRAFTYRQVAQNVGQKVCLMPAHYGYLQNNPKVGVFVGAFPENDTVYLINQKAQGGYFDKHIAMFGFLTEQQAVDTYQKCFEYGYIGLMSVIPCTIEQLKWWLINGDKSRPVTKERLPYAGLERLDSVLWGGEDKADLASHGGQVSKLLYQIRQSDSFNHALEPLSYHDLTQELGNQGFVYENYDALVIEYNKLERKAKQMLMAMQGAADVVKPVGVAVSKPLTKGGVANVIAWFEMDDGQAVGVFFHNPDKTPKKIDPTDEMISYKWVLNKKDITIVVAPENGKDLVIRTVAKRIMKLVDANHDRFLKANSDKAELNLKEQKLNAEVAEKQAELDALNKEIEALEAQKAEKEANKLKVPTGEELRQQGYNGVISELKKLGWTDDSVTGGLSKSFIGANEKGTINPNGILNVIVTAKDANMMATVGGDTIVSGSVVIIPQYGVTAQTEESYKKEANTINNAVEAYVAKRREEIQSSALKTTGKLSTPQELVQAADVAPIEENLTPTQDRPADYRTNLANARAVAKSLGIETKGKKLDRLLKDIDIFDANQMKKQVLAEFKALASRLVLPKGYAIDLKEAEKSIDDASYLDVSAFINKNGNVDKNDVQYVELRVSPRTSPKFFYGYTFAGNRSNPKVKDDFQRFPQSEEYTTAKDIVAKMEEFLIKAVFPKIEYLKVLNSTNVDVSKLSEIGIAEITDIGNENLYFEKDGKYYISKVGNTEDYALGEWDFAKYPDGKPVSPVTQPEPTPVVSESEPTPAVTQAEQPASEPSKPLSDIVIKALLSQDSEAWYTDDYGDVKSIYSADERDGFFIRISDKSKQVDLTYTDWETDQKQNETFVADTISPDQVIDRIKAFITKYEQNSVELSPVQPISEPPMTNPDRDLLGFATMAALSTQTKQERDKKKSPDFVANTLAEKWTKALNGDSKAIKDIRDYFVSNKRVPNMTKAHLIILEGLTGQDFNSKTYEYVVQKFDDYINTITQSQEPVATNLDRDYLQSIIDGSMTPKSSDMDVVIALAGKYETDEDMIPLLEQALEKINQTQQAAVKEVA